MESAGQAEEGLQIPADGSQRSRPKLLTASCFFLAVPACTPQAESKGV